MNKQPLLGEGGDAEIKKENDKRFNAVEQKVNMLKGYEGAWIRLRRNNWSYVLNKIVSMVIAISFAFITIIFKPTTQAY